MPPLPCENANDPPAWGGNGAADPRPLCGPDTDWWEPLALERRWGGVTLNDPPKFGVSLAPPGRVGGVSAYLPVDSELVLTKVMGKDPGPLGEPLISDTPLVGGGFVSMAVAAG